MVTHAPNPNYKLLSGPLFLSAVVEMSLEKNPKKKSKVYVAGDGKYKSGPCKGQKKAKKVQFGDPNMRIRKSNPKARKSFRARHNCDNPGPKLLLHPGTRAGQAFVIGHIRKRGAFGV